MRLAVLVLSLLLCSPAWATVNVVRFPSGTPVQVCQPSDTNTNCGGGGSSGLTIGTTPIVSGTNTYLEYNNNGKLGEIPQSTFVTGTPWTSTTLLLDQTTPQTIINGTPIIPSINGSASANGSLTLQGTSNATSTTSYLNLQPNGGNVGIGTTVPIRQLTMTGQAIIGSATTPNSAATLQVVGGGGSGYSEILMDSSKTYGLTYQYTSPSGVPTFNVFGDYYSGSTVPNLVFGTYPYKTNQLVLANTGNVGIGTTSPAAKLDVVAGTNNDFDGLTIRPLNLSQSLAIGYNGFNSSYSIHENATGDGTYGYRFQVGNSDKMVILTNGNVGIGTTSPTGFLNVLGVTEQERLSYDSTHYSSHTVNSAGDLTIGGTTGVVNATTFVGALTGNVTGTASGNLTSAAIGSSIQAYNSNLTGINQALTSTSSPSFTTVTAALSGNASTATTAANLSGTPALPNGTTATTQSAGDNSTKLATTAYVNGITKPTIQQFTSGSGTYTTPANVTWIKVRMVGGGGGGGGSGTTESTSGGTGGSTTFGSSLLSAGYGNGASFHNNSTSGGSSSTINSPAIGFSMTGGCGAKGTNLTNTTYTEGGNGGNSVFGGGGGGGPNINTASPIAGMTNTGGGGGGGGGSTGFGGDGGGAGSYVEAIIVSPSSTYSYAVGAGGSAGAAGTGGYVGAAGGSGFIIVEEHYGA